MAVAVVTFEGTDASTPLSHWLRAFARHRNPQVIAAALAVAAAARTVLGGWQTADALVFAGFVAAQPFTEWIVHVVILHARWFDSYLAKKHRAHHRDPRDVELIFVPFRSLVVSMLGAVVLYPLAFRDARLALSAIVVSYALLLVYEWTHFLVHSPYRPKTWAYRRVWRAHRLHHYKNERYWFGITSHIADRVLRTYPEKSDVETSPTARNLAA